MLQTASVAQGLIFRSPSAPATETPASEGAAATDGLLDASDLLLFAGGVLLVFGVVYLMSRILPAQGLKGASAFVTFGRLYSLVTVAVLAVLLAFASVGDESRTAAFAVLGTIAGFLAGANSTTTVTKPAGDNAPTTETTQSGI